MSSAIEQELALITKLLKDVIEAIDANTKSIDDLGKLTSEILQQVAKSTGGSWSKPCASQHPTLSLVCSEDKNHDDQCIAFNPYAMRVERWSRHAP